MSKNVMIVNSYSIKCTEADFTVGSCLGWQNLEGSKFCSTSLKYIILIKI